MRTKQQERSAPGRSRDRAYRSKTNLRQRMSELVSLREQVAQAELATLNLDSEGDEGSKHATMVREKHREPPV
jgi:hypothetical protein